MLWYTTCLVCHTVSKNPDSAYQSVGCILKTAITELQEHDEKWRWTKKYCYSTLVRNKVAIILRVHSEKINK